MAEVGQQWPPCLAGSQPVLNSTSTKDAHSCQFLHLLGIRPRLALFPKIQRRTAHTYELPIRSRRQTKLASVRCKAASAEASWRVVSLSVCLSRLRCYLSPGEPQFPLQVGNLPLQLSDCATLLNARPFQALQLRPHFFARDTGDFRLQDRCDICHNAHSACSRHRTRIEQMVSDETSSS